MQSRSFLLRPPQPNFSPDLRFVMSGDAQGRCFFWEWQHPAKIVRTIQVRAGCLVRSDMQLLIVAAMRCCGGL